MKVPSRGRRPVGAVPEALIKIVLFAEAPYPGWVAFVPIKMEFEPVPLIPIPALVPIEMESWYPACATFDPALVPIQIWELPRAIALFPTAIAPETPPGGG